MLPRQKCSLPRVSGVAKIMLRENLAELLHILIDCLPQSVVATEWYVRMRRFFSAHPQRFCEPSSPAPAMRLRRPSQTRGQWIGRKFVSQKTDLCVEGFPGSANTFVSNTIREALVGCANIESHFHWTAQLKRALALQAPTLVVVREPHAACSSLKSKRPQLRDWIIVLRWMQYHRFVLQHRARLDIVLFEDVIRDVDLIRRVSPAVNRLVHAPLWPYGKYQNPSIQRTLIQDNRRIVRYMLGYATQVYDALATVRPEQQ